MGLTQLFNKKEPGDPVNSDIIDKVEVAANKLDEVIKRITARTKSE